MRKIPTLFIRDENDRRHVTQDVTPGCEWVTEGEGVATFKWDGTAVLVDNGYIWKRREVGAGKAPPDGFRHEQTDEVTGKSFGWVRATTNDPSDRWLFEAADAWHDKIPSGTYELVGPKVQGNPHRQRAHRLVRHGDIRMDAPRLYHALSEYMAERRGTLAGFEGIVWHHPDGRMCKLKARDLLTAPQRGEQADKDRRPGTSRPRANRGEPRMTTPPQDPTPLTDAAVVRRWADVHAFRKEQADRHAEFLRQVDAGLVEPFDFDLSRWTGQVGVDTTSPPEPLTEHESALRAHPDLVAQIKAAQADRSNAAPSESRRPRPTTTLAFLDTETTSLDPDTGEIWEVAVVIRDTNGDEHARHWMLDVTLEHADPVSLDIGKFNDRHPMGGNGGIVTSPAEFAAQFAGLTRGAHLVGNVVSFDEERLRRLLLRHGHTPGWHYHLVDCEALVAGRLQIPPPWKSADLSAAVGVDLPEEAHTAMGDVEWAMRLYDAAMTPLNHAPESDK